ncbi:MAG: glutathione-regulated potassium-efflux system protein, partial [Pseudomonadota bacterium]
FMAIGLSLNLSIVLANWKILLIAVPVIMVVKSAIIYGLCRIAGSSHNHALKTGFLLAQGGEFAFVLFTAAAGDRVFSGEVASTLIAVVTLTMALTPLYSALPALLIRPEKREILEEDFEGADADVLMIGFSRFGQIVAQILLAGGRTVTTLDHSAERIRQASRFGFRIYFGDGTRKDVLVAAGIEKAKIVAICTNKQEITDQIVDLVQAEYPDARIFARAYDRGHTLALRAKGVEYEIRETLESGLTFGRKTLEALGVPDSYAQEITDDVRRRDEERLAIQAVQGITAGREMILTKPVPEPLVKPERNAAE